MGRIKNKLFIFVFILLLIVSFSLGTAAENVLKIEKVDFGIYVNGAKKTIDKDIYTIDDSTYVPLRALSEMIGMDVNWDAKTDTIKISDPVSTPDGDKPTVIPYEMTEEDIAAESWYPFRKDGLWGMMDSEGNIKIEPISYRMFKFSEGLAAIEVSNRRKIGYINCYGENVILGKYFRSLYSPGYDEKYIKDSFSNGLAMVVDGNSSKYGYINRKGEVVIPFEYYYGSCPFENGIAKVGIGRTPYNTRNEMMEQGVYTSLLADYYYNYIDTKGNIIFKDKNQQPITYIDVDTYVPESAYGIRYNKETDEYYYALTSSNGNDYDIFYNRDYKYFDIEDRNTDNKSEENRIFNPDNSKVYMGNFNATKLIAIIPETDKMLYNEVTYLVIVDENDDTYIIDIEGNIIRPKYQ